MQYGAYRRWKIGESESGQPTVKGKGKAPPGKRKKTKGGDSKNAAEKFYDAIKNLGSGPGSAGVSQYWKKGTCLPVFLLQ